MAAVSLAGREAELVDGRRWYEYSGRSECKERGGCQLALSSVVWVWLGRKWVCGHQHCNFDTVTGNDGRCGLAGLAQRFTVCNDL
jgi:hypothetical protein